MSRKIIRQTAKILLAIIVIAVLAVSIWALSASYSLKSSIDYADHIIETSSAEELAATESLGESPSTIVISCSDGLDFAGSAIALTKGETTVVVEVPSGVGGVEYDGTTEYFLTTGGMTVQLIDVVDIAASATGEFDDADGNHIVCGQKAITDNVGISVTYELAEEVTVEDIAAVQTVLESVKEYDGECSATFLGVAVNPSYLSDVVLAGDSVSFSNGENTVIVSTYDGSLTGADFDETLSLAGGLTASYGDIVDADTGYIPYIVEPDGGKVKLLATSNDVLADFLVDASEEKAD